MLILCLKIFFGRILDVSLGTIRTVLTVKEKHAFASICGFVEVAIWFTIVSEALSSAQSDIAVVIAYAAGFSCGTYIGGRLSSKLIGGYCELHVIIDQKLEETVTKLHDSGFGVSVIDVNPSVFSGKKNLLVIAASKAQIDVVKKIIYSENPTAFIILDETKNVNGGYLKRK